MGSEVVGVKPVAGVTSGVRAVAMGVSTTCVSEGESTDEGAGVTTSTLNEQPELKTAMTQSNAVILFISNPFDYCLDRFGTASCSELWPGCFRLQLHH